MAAQRLRRRHGLPVEAVLALAVMLAPAALLAQNEWVGPRQDFQTWMTLDTTHPLSKKIDFLLNTGLRYSNDQGHLMYHRIATGFAFRWNTYFTFEPYYQYSASDSFSGGLRHEHRLAFATTVNFPVKHWLISNRHLGEQRFREGQRSWRYRNRTEFRRPIALVHRRLTVFAWDEVYYSSRAGRWFRNRFALGAGRSLGRRFSVDVFYVHQNDGYSHPGDLNGLGMTIKTRF